MRSWLKNARNEKNMTMKEAGAKLGISESYYCAIENGTRPKKMDIALITSLSIVFDIPITKIIFLESAEAEAVASAVPTN